MQQSTSKFRIGGYGRTILGGPLGAIFSSDVAKMLKTEQERTAAIAESLDITPAGRSG